jgi:hypothetical protein
MAQALLLIDVKSLAAEGDVAAARVACTPQGAHIRKHELTVRDPHQYNSLQKCAWQALRLSDRTPPGVGPRG